MELNFLVMVQLQPQSLQPPHFRVQRVLPGCASFTLRCSDLLFTAKGFAAAVGAILRFVCFVVIHKSGGILGLPFQCRIMGVEHQDWRLAHGVLYVTSIHFLSQLQCGQEGQTSCTISFCLGLREPDENLEAGSANLHSSRALRG